MLSALVLLPVAARAENKVVVELGPSYRTEAGQIATTVTNITDTLIVHGLVATVSAYKKNKKMPFYIEPIPVGTLKPGETKNVISKFNETSKDVTSVDWKLEYTRIEDPDAEEPEPEEMERDIPPDDKASGAELPEPFSGDGPMETDVFQLDKQTVVFHYTHEGSGSFIVKLVGHTNESSRRVANASGQTEGANTIKIAKNGVYSLSVKADGPWTITITPPDENGPKPFTTKNPSIDVKKDKDGTLVFQ